MSRVSIHISEPTPGRIQCEIEGVDREAIGETATFDSDLFYALPMPQRFGLVLNEALKQTDLGKYIMAKCIGGDDDEGETHESIQYPCRCRITDPEGEVVAEDATHEAIALANPSVAVPKLGRTGWAHKEPDGVNVRIKLDDGSELMGYECWWEPIADTN